MMFSFERQALKKRVLGYVMDGRNSFMLQSCEAFQGIYKLGIVGVLVTSSVSAEEGNPTALR